MLLKAYYYYY